MNLLLSPLFWEVGGWLAFLFVGGLCMWADFGRDLSRKQQIGLLVALIGLLCFKRVLVLFINRELNPDESQLLSQALTLRYHPVYWKYVDGATMGPLSCYFVSLPGFFGVPLNYVVIRWLAFGCTLLSVAGGYFAIENFFSPRAARLAIFPAIAFLAFTTHLDFLHATNEHLSLALIGLAIWQYSRLWKQRAFDSVAGLFLLGFVSSLVPFAKLQGTPTVLIIVAAALIGLIRQYPILTPSRFWRALGGLLIGGLLFPVFVIGLTLFFGVFSDFIHFYIQSNLAYSAGAGFLVFLAHFPVFVSHTSDFVVFLLPTLALVIAWILFSRKGNGKSDVLFFSVAVLVSSAYAVIKPGNEFTHYLLYLVIPVCLLNAWFLDTFRRPVHTVFWVAAILGSVGINALMEGDNPSNKYRQIPFALRHFYVSPTAQEVLKLAKPGEDLVVWGWAPNFNVETQMPQGVCDNHTIREVMGSDQEVHRARYMRNIQASRPPVFLDAVGPHSTWLNDRARYGYETFPELKRYIDTNYRYVGEIDQTRVYARNDRYKQPTLTTTSNVDKTRTNL
ncbi:hypothetical protein [Spirosoma jeollabukense]